MLDAGLLMLVGALSLMVGILLGIIVESTWGRQPIKIYPRCNCDGGENGGV